MEELNTRQSFIMTPKAIDFSFCRISRHQDPWVALRFPLAAPANVHLKAKDFHKSIIA